LHTFPSQGNLRFAVSKKEASTSLKMKEDGKEREGN
jgi:hypothetical protein